MARDTSSLGVTARAGAAAAATATKLNNDTSLILSMFFLLYGRPSVPQAVKDVLA